METVLKLRFQSLMPQAEYSRAKKEKNPHFKLLNLRKGSGFESGVYIYIYILLV